MEFKEIDPARIRQLDRRIRSATQELVQAIEDARAYGLDVGVTAFPVGQSLKPGTVCPPLSVNVIIPITGQVTGEQMAELRHRLGFRVVDTGERLSDPRPGWVNCLMVELHQRDADHWPDWQPVVVPVEASTEDEAVAKAGAAAKLLMPGLDLVGRISTVSVKRRA